MICDCGYPLKVEEYRNEKEKYHTILLCAGCGKKIHDYKNK
jgi:hypothetical protein